MQVQVQVVPFGLYTDASASRFIVLRLLGIDSFEKALRLLHAGGLLVTAEPFVILTFTSRYLPLV